MSEQNGKEAGNGGGSVTEGLPAVVDFSEALVRQIAMDVGKQVVAHIEGMYPQMFRSVSKASASLSIRNTAYNAIMEAVKAANNGEVELMLARHDKHRRTIRKLRKATSIDELKAAYSGEK